MHNTTKNPNLLAMRDDDVSRLEVGPGCYRRDLPAGPSIRAWIVDIEPGCEWPYVDAHTASGESVFVVSGELIEGESRYGAGTYLYYAPHSTHRPRTENGVRLFGFNHVD